jgi:hypothetical protein
MIGFEIAIGHKDAFKNTPEFCCIIYLYHWRLCSHLPVGIVLPFLQYIYVYLRTGWTKIGK